MRGLGRLAAAAAVGLLCIASSFGVGATIVVGVEADLISPDPALSQRHPVTQMIYSLLYAPLFRLEPESGRQAVFQSVQPEGPALWQLVIDPNSGLSAAEVAAALRRAYTESGLAGYTAPSRDRLPWIVDVWVADHTSVYLQLSRSVPSLPLHLAQEYLALPGAGGEPVGTGPYRLAQWSPGNSITLIKKEPGGEPHDRLVFDVIPSLSQRVQAFVAGAIDVLPYVPLAYVDGLLAVEGTEIQARPGTRSRFIELNTTKPPFDDARVRKALNLAIDVPAMLHDVYGGFGYPLATIVPPTTVGYDTSLEPYPFDLQAARELLVEAGYPEGFDFELDVLAERYEEALYFARMWEAVGVRASLRGWRDWVSLKDAVLEGNRLAWTAEWNNTSRDPSSVLGAKVRTGGSANYGGYSHAEVDRLLRSAQGCQSVLTCAPLFAQVQRTLWSDAAMVFGYVEAELLATRAPVGWELWP